jgi:hypothetical protein
VCCIQLAGTLTTPQEVGTAVIPAGQYLQHSTAHHSTGKGTGYTLGRTARPIDSLLCKHAPGVLLTSGTLGPCLAHRHCVRCLGRCALPALGACLLLQQLSRTCHLLAAWLLLSCFAAGPCSKLLPTVPACHCSPVQQTTDWLLCNQCNCCLPALPASTHCHRSTQGAARCPKHTVCRLCWLTKYIDLICAKTKHVKDAYTHHWLVVESRRVRASS